MKTAVQVSNFYQLQFNDSRLGSHTSPTMKVVSWYNKIMTRVTNQSIESINKAFLLTADRHTTYPEELNSDKVNPKSLLKKYLTQETFDQLKGVKTSKGSTLWDCIKTGVINVDSSVGVYAGDEECYRVFAALFDPLIEDYHSPYKLADGHTSSMDAEEVKYPDLDPEGKFIRSTRVRVARNLSGYGLPPTVTKEERLEIEKKVFTCPPCNLCFQTQTLYPLFFFGLK